MTLESVLGIQRWGWRAHGGGGGLQLDVQGDVLLRLVHEGRNVQGEPHPPRRPAHLLLEGKGRYVFREDGKNVDYHLVEGEVLDIPAGQPHIFLPEEDCLTVEWWDGDFEAEEFDFSEYTVGIKKEIEEFNKRVEELKKARVNGTPWT